MEGVFLQHVDILDVGVVGIYEPAKEFQVIRAYVVKRQMANISEEDICQWMKKESSQTAHLTTDVEFLESSPEMR